MIRWKMRKASVICELALMFVTNNHDSYGGMTRVQYQVS